MPRFQKASTSVCGALGIVVVVLTYVASASATGRLLKSYLMHYGVAVSNRSPSSVIVGSLSGRPASQPASELASSATVCSFAPLTS